MLAYCRLYFGLSFNQSDCKIMQSLGKQQQQQNTLKHCPEGIASQFYLIRIFNFAEMN